MAQTGVGTGIAYKVESVFGTKPAASGSQLVRRVTWTLGLRKGTVQSAEVRSDRAIADYRHTNRTVDGVYTGELSVGSGGEDDFIEAVSGSTWAAGASSGALTDVTAATGPNTFTRGTGSWITAGFRVGDIVRWTGWTTGGAGNNSKNFRITALTATIMTVAETVAAKAAGDSVTGVVQGKKLLFPGTTKRSFSVEHKHTDLTVPQYEAFTGVRMGSLALGLDPAGLVTFNVGMMGRDAEALSSSEYFTAPTAAGTGPILSFAQGKIRLAGTDVAVVTAIDLTIDNGLSTIAVGGSNFTPDVFWGRQPITGTMTALFEDTTFPNAFNAETEIALDILLEAAGTAPAEFHKLTFPRVKLGGDNRPVDTEGPIRIGMPFVPLLAAAAQTALNYDSASLVWQRSNV